VLGLATDDEVGAFMADVEAVGRLVDALRAQVAGEVDHRSRRTLGEDGLASRFGCPRPEHLIERLTGVSQAEAARRIRLARLLRADTALDGSPLPQPYPFVDTALAAGEIGVEAALAITVNLERARDRADRERIAAGEAWLVGEARSSSADLVAGQAKTWRDALDPDGSEPRVDRIHRLRRFSVGRETVDGLTPFSGLAEPEFAATLRSALSERTSPARRPRFLDLGDAPAGDAGPCDDIPDDPRTSDQRRYDILQGLLLAGIRADGTNRTPLTSVATVNVVVRASDLANASGPAWLDDVRDPISAALAEQIACDGGIQIIGVGAHGEPLWLGRRERLFTAAQRRALAVRDGGCVFPGCTAPPSWSQAHHVVPWGSDGATDIDNGVLLCHFHHRVMHRGDFRMRMRDGRPELLSPRWIDPDQRWRPVGGARWQRAA